MGIEIDDRSETKEQEREQAIKEAGITLIRIDPDKKNFDLDNEISEIQNFIYKSGVKLTQETTKNTIVEDCQTTTHLISIIVLKK